MINRKLTQEKKDISILFLTNNNNAMELFEWISSRCKADIYKEKLSVDVLEKLKPDLVISYNYKYIIKPECITYMQERIINLHISLLPYNRGASPNFWSFIDDTPKGVTIHLVSSGIDEGDIIFQKELFFDESKETFESTYNKLNESMCNLFKEYWDKFIDGSFMCYRKKQKGKSTKHTTRDLEVMKNKIDFKWSDNIKQVLLNIDEIK